MSLMNFAQDNSTREEVFAYLKAFTDKYALAQVYAGKDVSGLKNAEELIKLAHAALISEFVKTKKKKKLDRSV